MRKIRGPVRKVDQSRFINVMRKVVKWDKKASEYLYDYLMELSDQIDEPIEFEPAGFAGDFTYAGADEVEDGVYGDDIEEDHIAKFKIGGETNYLFYAR